jgi:hypothetical protein
MTQTATATADRIWDAVYFASQLQDTLNSLQPEDIETMTPDAANALHALAGILAGIHEHPVAALNAEV